MTAFATTESLVDQLRVAGGPGVFQPAFAPLLNSAAEALAAVTAERDQARQMLADAEKKIATMELDESLREEDERFADPL